MVKTQVKVYVRTRPTASNYDGLRIGGDGQTVSVNVPKDVSAGLVNNQQENFSFKYDGVLENVSQESCYTTCAHEVVDSLIAGYNGTIFCYGQTGAGKTFTMSGDLHNYSHRGIIPRAIRHVFQEVDMRVDKLYRLHVSHMEIYNEQLYDLLSDHPGTADSLAVLEDNNNNTYVRGLTLVPVRSEEEALAQFFLGEQGRATSSHVLNASSSRSHSVFTIHMEMRTSEAASERAVLSKLHLVDLAGSERTKKTGVSGQSLKEAQFINKSLSFLEQTVNSLSRKDAYVPFRQTKLTAVLRDALGGNCKTVMVANIWGEASHSEETLSTLRFASRVRTLTTDLAVNESNDPGLMLRRYERQIKELKAELAMRDTLSGRARVSYDDLTDDELRALHATARRFLSGDADVEQLPADSLKRVREAFKALRAVHQSTLSELSAQLSATQRVEAAAGGAEGAGAAGGGDGGTVGDVDHRATVGFVVGTAPADARPPARSEVDPSSPGAMSRGASRRLAPLSTQASSAFYDSPGSPMAGGQGAPDSPLAGGRSGIFSVQGDRNAVYRRYKQEVAAGKQVAGELRAAQGALKETRASIKALALSVNAAKRQVDELSGALAQRRGNAPPGGDGEVLDSEAYALAQELKAAKAKYRQDFDALKAARDSLEPQSRAAAAARAALVDAFDKWCSQQTVATLRKMATAGHAMPAAVDEEEDLLDAGEAFEKMQLERISAKDPDSLAYHAALRRTAGVALKPPPTAPGTGATARRDTGSPAKPAPSSSAAAKPAAAALRPAAR